MSFPPIDGDRLWSDLMTLARIGELPAGGCDRLALSDADGMARNVFRYWMEEIGLKVSVDPIGNMVGRREGTDPSLPPIMMGSHLDTQQPGGKYDGPLGVLGGLACLRAIAAAGRATRHPIEVVNWTNEEGARFQPGLLGSAVFTGQLDLETAHATKDVGGRSVFDELRRIRYLGDAPLQRKVDSYFELHIEQGDRLEKAGITIGNVAGCEYNLFAEITCHGRNGHSQATPMDQRANALAAAAEVIVAIEEIGRRHFPAGSAGVASLRLWPNNRINIPHLARMSYSATHPDRAGMAQIRREVTEAVEAAETRTGLRIEIEQPPEREAVDFDASLGALVERAAEELGHSTMSLRSRAGHDAIRMAPHCPTQMIFVPCKDGISHSEFEEMTKQHAVAGTEVMLRAVLARDGAA
ncbi:hydantoinase/carbamoylase family amidase [Enterovirga rhinocerotis]|uniref:N-carbamoyl-L-amino-acid hydrolase n=1 Tax=Enterovirga rhinocerotis TaxID=1339210 RepID=A0A4R7C953_9HYPH|nr:hydantoinase/carbamoylase family amidase [Enterovirga rhinocerotis]TDR94968.1 N-carbamoyl-L-amino-acid hydrolase [Enterovirga rhinocerotis]